MRRITIYIYQQPDWPHFQWDNKVLLPLLANVRHLQGKLLGKMQAIGFALNSEAVLTILTQDVLKSTEIEGEIFEPAQVRSSVARKLDMDIAAMVASNKRVDGMVEMMLDATKNYQQPLTKQRLFAWHFALFPTSINRMFKIKVAEFRDDCNGPMQVVSGVLGKEKVHYQAPDANLLNKEITQFLDWFNHIDAQDLVLKAAISHIWFITLHPFDDGNGRIARAIADSLLAQADGTSQRFYSMSTQIQKQREEYYKILEQTQKGTTDITKWLQWFLQCLHNALMSSETTLATTVNKHKFWNMHTNTILNERQQFMLKILLDGYNKPLNTSTWAKLCKCSTDTALRDIQDLMKKEILVKTSKGGRSSSYIMGGKRNL